MSLGKGEKWVRASGFLVPVPKTQPLQVSAGVSREKQRLAGLQVDGETGTVPLGKFKPAAVSLAKPDVVLPTAGPLRRYFRTEEEAFLRHQSRSVRHSQPARSPSGKPPASGPSGRRPPERTARAARSAAGGVGGLSVTSMGRT